MHDTIQAASRTRRVLLVEDDTATREALARLVAGQGHEVHAAADGLRGLQALRDFRPERLVLDLMLPDFAGERLLEAVRTTNPKTRVAVVTAVGDEARLKELEGAGAEIVFRKPILPSALLDWLRSP